MNNNNKRTEALVERFRNSCLEAGIKLTHQRLEIYRGLTSTKEHPSAEAIYKRLRKNMPSISLDTAYRNLSLLSDYGLIKKIRNSREPSKV